MDKFDPREWAKSQKPRASNKCQTCKIEEIRLATRHVLEERVAGKAPHVSMSMMWEKWREVYKYPYCYSTFKGHVTGCEAELWKLCRASGKT